MRLPPLPPPPRARAQATTEVIAQLDVDMLISGHMTRWLEHSNNSARMVQVRTCADEAAAGAARKPRLTLCRPPPPWQACRDKSVFVLPAFETHGKNTSHSAQLSDKLAMQSKRKLVRMLVEQSPRTTRGPRLSLLP